MSKLKLNIQRFSATNHTAHYNLSQYISTDKPTYLVDYNSDMLAIDTAIYNAMSKATVNESNIGTIENLTTTVKTDLVSALNEVNSQVGTNTGNISTNTSNIATLGDNQGDLINLTTTAKNNLVSAINEVKGVNDTQNTNISKNTSNIETLNSEVQKFNFTSFTNYGSNDIQSLTGGGTITDANVTVATNSDGSIGKVYGYINISNPNANTNIVKKIATTNLRPSSEITINFAGMLQRTNDKSIGFANLTIATNGDITFTINRTSTTNDKVLVYLPPCVYFMKDFGDINPE